MRRRRPRRRRRSAGILTPGRPHQVVQRRAGRVWPGVPGSTWTRMRCRLWVGQVNSSREEHPRCRTPRRWSGRPTAARSGARAEVIGDRWSLLVLREVIQRHPALRPDDGAHRDPAPGADRPARAAGGARGCCAASPTRSRGSAAARVPAHRQGHRPLPGAASRCRSGATAYLAGPERAADRVRAPRLQGAGRPGAALPGRPRAGEQPERRRPASGPAPARSASDAASAASAGVAQPGGDAVDREQQRLAQPRVRLLAGRGAARPAQQRDLQVADRVEVGVADLQGLRPAAGWTPSSLPSPVTGSTSRDRHVVLGADGVEDVVQVAGRRASRRSAPAIRRSVLASVIATLDRNVRKKCQPSYISSSTCRRGPASRAAASPEPTPYQPGTICRDWVQPKTHGIARSPSSPAPLSGRRDGPGPDVEVAEQLDGGRLHEVRRQVGVARRAPR